MPNLKVWDNAGGVWRYVSSGPLGVTGLQGVQGNTGVQSAHVLAYTGGLGAFHSATGLVTGQVLKATSATAAGFGVITNITPGANFTLTQNSVVPFTSEETSAVVNTLYLKAGNVGIGTTNPTAALDVVNQMRISSADGAYRRLIFYSTSASPTQNNWQIAMNEVSNRLHIGPSTAAGGTTFSSVTGLVMDANGAVGIGYDSMGTAKLAINGNVGIGTTGPNYKLEVSTDSAGKPGIGGLWTVVSDKNLKDNIVLADLDRCYEIIKTTPLKRFTWKDEAFSSEQLKDRSNTGFIAQDVQKVFPKAVNKIPFKMANGDVLENCLDLNNGQMLMSLFGATQKMMAMVEKMQTDIEILKKK